MTKISLPNLVTLACHVIEEHGGYVSAKSVSEPIRTRRGIIQVRAKDEDGNTLKCTSDYLKDKIKSILENLPVFEIKPNDKENIDSNLLDLADKIIDYYKNLTQEETSKSDFLFECRATVNIPEIDVEDKSNSKAIGIIAYLPEGYRRAIEKQEKKQKAIDDNKDSKSDFVGTEGTRLQTKATVVDIKPIRNRDFSVVSCVDEDDNVIKWFEGDTYDIKTNKLYDLSGFIKSHSVNSYNNVKETIINRVRFA